MGWNSAGGILEVVALALDKNFPGKMGHPFKEAKKNVLIALIDELENSDADTLDEQFGTTDDCDDALVAMKYHKWVHGECDWNEDFTGCVSEKCGWKERE